MLCFGRNDGHYYTCGGGCRYWMARSKVMDWITELGGADCEVKIGGPETQRPWSRPTFPSDLSFSYMVDMMEGSGMPPIERRHLPGEAWAERSWHIFLPLPYLWCFLLASGLVMMYVTGTRVWVQVKGAKQGTCLRLIGSPATGNPFLLSRVDRLAKPKLN